jgi:hypothetical protein
MDARWKLLTPFQIPKVLHVGRQENAKIGDQIKGTHKVPHGLPQLEKEPSNFEVFNLKNFDI